MVSVAVIAASLSIGVGAALAGGGAISPPDPPTLKDVVCISTCGGTRKATEGSKVQLSGRNLGNVSRVLFSSAGAGRVRVDASSVSSRTVTAVVPDGAATGRPKVKDRYGNSSTSPERLRIVPASQIQDSGDFRLKDVSARPHRSYYYGKKKPHATFMFSNSQPTDVRIDVVRRKDGTVIDSWTKQAQEPNTAHTARWNGLAGRRPAPNGGYKFRIGPKSGTMESASQARFQYHGFKFPVRGPHSYGDGVGAPRVGHTHQGQDVLASCGTPLVAARGGRVQYKAYQSAAGNYLVIDGKKTSHDYVYMHLARPSKLHRGERVRTGERIGVVGQTGDATGCHLHFEEWSGPGWYQGGTFLKAVTRHLKKWDSWS